MKRAAAIIFALCILAGLCSCKKDGSSDDQTLAVSEAHSATRKYEDVRLHSIANEIAGGLFTGSLSDFNDEEKEMIRSYLLDRNYKIKYNDDGTAELSRAGEKWIITTKWPKNSYTGEVPEQTLGAVTMAMEDLSVPNAPKFVIMIKSDDDAQSYKKYKETLSKAGFKSVDGDNFDNESNFNGVKHNNLSVRINSTGKGYIMEIIKLPDAKK